MNLKYASIKRKVKTLRRHPVQMAAQTKEDAQLLRRLIEKYNPNRDKLKSLSGLGEMRFRRAWELVRPHVWRVGNGYEPKTETAQL